MIAYGPRTSKHLSVLAMIMTAWASLSSWRTAQAQSSPQLDSAQHPLYTLTQETHKIDNPMSTEPSPGSPRWSLSPCLSEELPEHRITFSSGGISQAIAIVESCPTADHHHPPMVIAQLEPELSADLSSQHDSEDSIKARGLPTSLTDSATGSSLMLSGAVLPAAVPATSARTTLTLTSLPRSRLPAALRGLRGSAGGQLMLRVLPIAAAGGFLIKQIFWQPRPETPSSLRGYRHSRRLSQDHVQTSRPTIRHKSAAINAHQNQTNSAGTNPITLTQPQPQPSHLQLDDSSEVSEPGIKPINEYALSRDVLFPDALDPTLRADHLSRSASGGTTNEVWSSKTVPLDLFLAQLTALLEDTSQRLTLLSSGLQALKSHGDHPTQLQKIKQDFLKSFFFFREVVSSHQSFSESSLEQLGLRLHYLSASTFKLQRQLAQYPELSPNSSLPLGLSSANLGTLRQQLTTLGGSLAGLRGRLRNIPFAKIDNPYDLKALRSFISQRITLHTLAQHLPISTHTTTGDDAHSQPPSSVLVVHLPHLTRLLGQIAERSTDLQNRFSSSALTVQVGYPAIIRYHQDRERLQLGASLMWVYLRYLERAIEERELEHAELTDSPHLDLEEIDYPFEWLALKERFKKNPTADFSDHIAAHEAKTNTPISPIYLTGVAQSFIKLSVLAEEFRERLGMTNKTIQDHFILWESLSPSARRHLALMFSRRSSTQASEVQRAGARILTKSVMLQMILLRSHRESAVFAALSSEGLVSHYDYYRLFYELSLPDRLKEVPLGTMVQRGQRELADRLEELDKAATAAMTKRLSPVELVYWQKQTDSRHLGHHDQIYQLSQSSRIFISAMPHLEDLVTTLEMILPDLPGELSEGSDLDAELK